MKMHFFAAPYVAAHFYADLVGQASDKVVGMLLLKQLPGKKMSDGEWYVNVFALTMDAVEHANEWMESGNKNTSLQHQDA